MRFACSSLVGGMLSGLILIILILINATHSEEHAFRSEKPSPIIIISHRRSYCVLLYLEKRTGSEAVILKILINATHSEEHAFRSEWPLPIFVILHRRYCVLLYLEKKTGSAVNSLQSCTHATCINCCCVGRLHVADCYGLVQANVICLLVSVVP